LDVFNQVVNGVGHEAWCVQAIGAF
jgi:hypothetical protein